MKSEALSEVDQKNVDAILTECLSDLTALADDAAVPAYKAILKKFDQKSTALIKDKPLYVSIVGPMMPLTDRLGLKDGMHQFVSDTLHRKASQLKHHGRYFAYAFFEPNQKALEYITQLVTDGFIKPCVSQVFSLESAAVAHEAIETGRTKGKIVLDLNLS
ncbi:MAG: reticulon 4 interacting protein 1 [uncultured bacterium]|nr:MAG: reticulon 4 interacting protein 1 [uncultured bacterium]